MTLRVELPPDIERAALDIPDLTERLAVFLRHQVDLEAWRSRRGSEKARALVDDAFAKADALKEGGLSDEEAFAKLAEVHGR
jgi:hypothetical protein